MSTQITLAGSKTLLPARQEWLSAIRPDGRLLTGRAYHAAKRIMDLVLVVLALPRLAYWQPPGNGRTFVLCSRAI